MTGAAAADIIRTAIVSADLASGQRLVQADLIAMLKTTRWVVTEALGHLVQEGLVEQLGSRGVRVRRISAKEALQTIETYYAIECVIVTNAALAITSDGIAELRVWADELRSSAKSGAADLFAEVTRRISDCCARIAGQPVAAKMLEQLQWRLSPYRLRLTAQGSGAQGDLPHWLALIEAICCRDADAARRALARCNERLRGALAAIGEGTAHHSHDHDRTI